MNAIQTADELPEVVKASLAFFAGAVGGLPQIHPSTLSVLRHFDYEHLPSPLKAVSKPFCEQACRAAVSTSGPETTAGLRKLLEAKDCMVRAHLHEKLKPEADPLATGKPANS